MVCQNTLSAAVGEGGTIAIRHTKGAADALKAAQQLMAKANGKFDKAAEVFRALARVNVTAKMIRAYVDAVFPAPKKPAIVAPVATDIDGAADFASLLAKPVKAAFNGGIVTDRAPVAVSPATEAQFMETNRERIYGEIETLFQRGRGNDMAGVKGTGWALYNGVTEYLTHERGRTQDTRLNTAWFGAESPRAIQAAQSIILRSTQPARRTWILLMRSNHQRNHSRHTVVMYLSEVIAQPIFILTVGCP